MAGYRRERLADVLSSFVAQELRRMSDPRLEFVTITEVRVTNDLRVATLFWTIPTIQRVPTTAKASESGAADVMLGDPTARPDEAVIEDVAAALERTIYMLKKKIAKELHLRYTPDLIFKFDDSPSNASRIEELLKRACAGNDIG